MIMAKAFSTKNIFPVLFIQPEKQKKKNRNIFFGIEKSMVKMCRRKPQTFQNRRVKRDRDPSL